MLKILNYKDSDTILAIILLTFIKLVLAMGLCLFAFYLAFASTMGPSIAPEIWIGSMPLDMVIRFAMMIAAVGILLFAIVWLFYPLLHYLYKKSFHN